MNKFVTLKVYQKHMYIICLKRYINRTGTLSIAAIYIISNITIGITGTADIGFVNYYNKTRYTV